MSFLYPQFLFGLAAIGIPIAIHLFNFQRFRRIAFTNVRFLRIVKSTTDANLKLKHLLVLLVRILFVAALVVAFAQPVIRQDGAAGAEVRTVSIYLDNSFSMQEEDGETSLLNRSVVQADALVRAYSEGTSFQLLTNSFAGKSQYFNPKDKAIEALTEVDLANAYRDAGAVLRRQQAAIGLIGAGMQTDLFWFSDFQRSTVGKLSDLPLDSSQRLHLVPLLPESPNNVWVDSVWLADPFYRAGENNELWVRMASSGNEAEQSLTLKLLVEGLQVSTASVSVPPSGTQDISMTFSVDGTGAKRCRLSFDDYPVTFDNEHYFVLRNARPINVIHVHEGIGRSGEFIPRVYRNEQYFNLRSFNKDNVDYDYLSKADLIVLDGLRNISGALRDAVRASVTEGRSLTIFPPKQVPADPYNDLLRRVNGPVIEPKGASASGSAVSTPTYTLAPPPASAPFFKGVFEETTRRNLDMPYGYPTLSWRGGQQLLSYRTGAPFLSQFSGRGSGDVYLFAAPLDADLTNLPRHAIFVPVMYRMAMRSLRETESLAFSLQSSNVSVDLRDEPTGQEVFVLRGEDAEWIPQQRRSGDQLLLAMPREEVRAGFYELTRNERTVKTLAFNYGRAESDVTYWTVDELKEQTADQPNVLVYDPKETSDLAQAFAAASIGVPLWKWALLAALLFLCAEGLMLRLWKS
ncbi:MAG: BatA domain-containing protein [Catalinimonas sp.]